MVALLASSPTILNVLFSHKRTSFPVSSPQQVQLLRQLEQIRRVRVAQHEDGFPGFHGADPIRCRSLDAALKSP